MYAIVRTGGKQYRVEEGRSFVVERLPAEEGQTVELGEVLLIAEDGTVTVGTPMIEGARVLAHVDSHGRGPKIIVYKYKNKVRTRRKTGHRQPFTQLTVEDILLPGQEAKAKPKRARKPKAEDEAPEEEAIDVTADAPEGEAEAIAEPVTGTPEAEDDEKPKRRTRRAEPKAKAKPEAKAKAEKPKRATRGKAEPAKEEKKPARRRIIRRGKKE